jgi:hypothetical protein
MDFLLRPGEHLLQSFVYELVAALEAEMGVVAAKIGAEIRSPVQGLNGPVARARPKRAWTKPWPVARSGCLRLRTTGEGRHRPRDPEA